MPDVANPVAVARSADAKGARPDLDWDTVSTVLLDMDGTLLDLGFDNWFWNELVPEHYGLRHGLDREEVVRRLLPEFESRRGTLDWYCLDFWTSTLGLDLQGLKHNFSQKIRFLPGAPKFLTRMRAMGKRLVLVTNAHSGILRLKLVRTGLDSYFDAVYSSHEFGVPKESGRFWGRLSAVEEFEPETSFFADDSPPVLASARDFGIRYVVGIRRPDAAAAARPLDGFHSVDAVVDLID